MLALEPVKEFDFINITVTICLCTLNRVVLVQTFILYLKKKFVLHWLLRIDVKTAPNELFKNSIPF